MPHEGVATPVGEGGRNPGWGRGPDPSKGTGCDPIRRRASRYMLGSRPQLGEGVVTPIGEVGRDPGKGWGSRPQLGKGDPVPIRVGGRGPSWGRGSRPQTWKEEQDGPHRFAPLALVVALGLLRVGVGVRFAPLLADADAVDAQRHHLQHKNEARTWRVSGAQPSSSLSALPSSSIRVPPFLAHPRRNPP